MWKEGNVLFNDALNTFYLRLYGVRKLNMNTVEGRKEGYVLFNDAFNKGSFICTMSQEARSNSVVERPIMVRWVVGSIPHGRLI